MKRLAFIPTDPLSIYQNCGYNDLYAYYNPGRLFDEIVCVSPYPEEQREIQGIPIICVHGYEEYISALKRIQPSVIRAYGAFYSADLANYYPYDDIPIITSVHDVAEISPSICCSDMVICVSQAVANQVRDIGVDAKRIRLLPNRVNLSNFKDRKGEMRTEEIRRRFPDGKMLLSVARKTKQKNIDNLIRALRHLPEDFFLVLVGKGEEEQYIRLSEEERVSERCHWIDHVQSTELSYWYSAADCFCLPSRWEGFGIVFIEAAACGVPIVTSDIAPMNEFLDEDSAFLVREYENPEEIAKAIELACTSKSAAKKAENAIRVANSFSKESIDEMEKTIYSDALKMTHENRLIRYEFSNDAVMIWGAGMVGKEIFNWLQEKGVRVSAFIDNNPEKRGSTYCGIDVLSPETVSDAEIIVPNRYYHQVLSQIRTANIKITGIVDYNRLRAQEHQLGG